MSESEQVASLAADLTKLIDRYRAEYDLTLATVIGTLEVIKIELWQEHASEDE